VGVSARPPSLSANFGLPTRRLRLPERYGKIPALTYALLLYFGWIFTIRGRPESGRSIFGEARLSCPPHPATEVGFASDRGLGESRPRSSGLNLPRPFEVIIPFDRKKAKKRVDLNPVAWAENTKNHPRLPMI